MDQNNPDDWSGVPEFGQTPQQHGTFALEFRFRPIAPAVPSPSSQGSPVILRQPRPEYASTQANNFAPFPIYDQYSVPAYPSYPAMNYEGYGPRYPHPSNLVYDTNPNRVLVYDVAGSSRNIQHPVPTSHGILPGSATHSSSAFYRPTAFGWKQHAMSEQEFLRHPYAVGTRISPIDISVSPDQARHAAEAFQEPNIEAQLPISTPRNARAIAKGTRRGKRGQGKRNKPQKPTPSSKKARVPQVEIHEVEAEDVSVRRAQRKKNPKAPTRKSSRKASCTASLLINATFQRQDDRPEAVQEEPAPEPMEEDSALTADQTSPKTEKKEKLKRAAVKTPKGPRKSKKPKRSPAKPSQTPRGRKPGTVTSEDAKVSSGSEKEVTRAHKNQNSVISEAMTIREQGSSDEQASVSGNAPTEIPGELKTKEEVGSTGSNCKVNLTLPTTNLVPYVHLTRVDNVLAQYSQSASSGSDMSVEDSSPVKSTILAEMAEDYDPAKIVTKEKEKNETITFYSGGSSPNSTPSDHGPPEIPDLRNFSDLFAGSDDSDRSHTPCGHWPSSHEEESSEEDENSDDTPPATIPNPFEFPPYDDKPLIDGNEAVSSISLTEAEVTPKRSTDFNGTGLVKIRSHENHAAALKAAEKIKRRLFTPDMPMLQ